MSFDWNLILKRLVGAFVWGLALAVAAWNVSVATGVLGAFAGGAAGFLTGPLLARTRLRTPTLWVAGVLAATMALWLCRLPAGSALVASLLGPELAYATYDGLTWLVGTFALVSVLHASTVRHGLFLIGELAVVGLALVTPLSAHRDGFINRPFFFVDPLWSRGWDPVPFLLGVGAFTAATLLVLTVGRFNRRNTLLDLGLLLLVALLVAAFLPLNKLQQLAPREQEAMGLQGDPREKDQPPPGMEGEGGEKGGQKPKEEPNPEEGGGQGNPSPVAVVIFHQDFMPTDGFYYFRQKVFSMFNGARLVADTTGAADRDVAAHFPVARAEEGGDPSGVGLTPEKMDPELARPVDTTVALIVPHTLPFGLLNPVKMRAAGNPDPEQFVRAYKVESEVFRADLSSLMGRPVGNPEWTAEQRAHYTLLPDDPRYKNLADEIVARLHEKYRDDPLAQAVMLKLWLETEGTYSLRKRELDSDDAVAEFLFGDKTGYCVHFAHSAAYLTRALGIPSRVATGYAVDARHRFGGSALVIQDSNSHAWCEIYLEGVGWVPLDVAPRNSEVQPPPPPDPDLQRMLGQLARKEAPTQEGKPQEKISLTELMRNAAIFLARALAVLLGVGLLGLYAWKIARRLSPFTGGETHLVNRAYRASLDRLADAGVFRSFGQTREDFARGNTERFPHLEELTRLHVETSLGWPDKRPAPARQHVLQLHRDLGREIARSRPWWRRMLGALNPFNWLFVR